MNKHSFVEPCSHGWRLPPGAPCPDCCWERANSEYGLVKHGGGPRLDLVREAVEAAVMAVEGKAAKEYIRCLDAEDNAWIAIKEARRLNREEG